MERASIDVRQLRENILNRTPDAIVASHGADGIVPTEVILAATQINMNLPPLIVDVPPMRHAFRQLTSLVALTA